MTSEKTTKPFEHVRAVIYNPENQFQLETSTTVLMTLKLQCAKMFNKGVELRGDGYSQEIQELGKQIRGKKIIRYKSRLSNTNYFAITNRRMK